jgi:hypothetical protein
MPAVTGNRPLRADPFLVRLDANQGCIPARGICWLRAGFLLGDISMMDVIMIALGVAFFAVSIGYVYACDRL